MNWLEKTTNLDLVNQAKQLIPAYFPLDLQQEILVQFDISEDWTYKDPFLLLYAIIYEVESSEGIPRKWIIAIRKYLIELGVYRAWSPEELSRVVSIGKKYDFKMQGQYYMFEEHPNGFIRENIDHGNY